MSRSALAVLLLAGCASVGPREEKQTSDLSAEVAKSEVVERESRTVSNLAALEKSVADYVQHEGKIPEKLGLLVPRYAAEIPSSDTGLRGHRAWGGVTYYPPSVIRDGVVDGTQIKDTGGWGYVHNERQVIVFVDCTHPNSQGRLWYREPGAFQWERAAGP